MSASCGSRDYEIMIQQSKVELIKEVQALEHPKSIAMPAKGLSVSTIHCAPD